MFESTITSKGRTTLPKPVREALGVRPGDHVRYIILGDEVRIIPMRPLARLFGALKYEGPRKRSKRWSAPSQKGPVRSDRARHERPRPISGRRRCNPDRSGASSLYTFDRRAAQMEGVVLVG